MAGKNQKTIVKLQKLDPQAVLPTQATAGAAGFDLVAIERATLTPGSRAVIRTGIAMEIPQHAYRPAPHGAVGAFSPVVGWLTWPASGGEPVQPSGGGCRVGLVSFRMGVVRPKASLCCCESWR